ncbi:MAG TPA: hypothetical protein VF796_22275 [Humisphaera sp.]
MNPRTLVVLALLVLASHVGAARAAPAAPPTTAPSALPPGWLPVHRLDDAPAWPDFRKVDDKVHLYLPPGVTTVRGVFVCYVFHSSDPRELARLWRFALVTVPWPFEYDLGFNDKRNGRFKLGHPVGDTSVLLRYLDAAATETSHPELAVAPIVGWLGQNGAKLCSDLYKRAPDRVLAWADAWYKDWPKYPDLIANVPVASAWEHNKKEREAEIAAAGQVPPDKPTPPADLRCYASTYGFPHGIYSKYNFFVAYLDRCIALRLPPETPPPGQPVKLRPVDLKAGCAGDYLPVSQWNPIAPYAEAKGMLAPQWMPDAYAAWMWRSYHSANPDLKITGPVFEYRKKDGKWGGPDCGLGYGNVVKPGTPLTFSAETSGTYAQVEFHDGDKIVGTATAAPWKVDGVKLDRGLHALFAVGVTADGKRTASRPGFLVVD